VRGWKLGTGKPIKEKADHAFTVKTFSSVSTELGSADRLPRRLTSICLISTCFIS
jgi:hypothetical protein